MIKTLLKNINENTTIVTPNRRLAFYLRQELDSLCKNLGEKVWSSFDILPITTWLQRIWLQSNPQKILLNNHQTRIIWQNIIANRTQDKLLLNSEAIATAAQQAYELLNEWCVSIEHPLFSISEDYLTFQGWVQEYIKICKSNNWLDNSLLPHELNSSHFPKHLILAGFDQITPQLKQLLENINCEYFDPSNKTPEQQNKVAIANQEQELINMALWTKRCAENNPEATIGCIIPELTAIRPKVEYIFSKINDSNFDISVGEKLSDFPIIYQTLNKLTSRTSTKSQLPSSWVKDFLILERDDYALIQRWQKLLEEFSSLDLILNKISYQKALQLLINLAQHTIFQPKRDHTNIKILGTLEAAGLNFDYLWIMGLTDKNWPPPPCPNPFIPIQLQKQLDMPHSSAERELQFCHTLNKRFSHSAITIIYSYPLKADDETLNPSPLIENIPLTKLKLPAYNPFPHQKITLETLADDQAPPITNNELIRGGSKIFKLQAACPFKAFAECRLNATASKHPSIGLNACERGLLVHTALQNIWQKIKTHQQLCSYSNPQLLDIIQQSLTQTNHTAFTKLETKRLTKLLYEWLTLEKTRIPFTILSQEQTLTIDIGKLKEISIRVDRIDKLEDNTLLIIDYKTGKTTLNSWFGERPDDPQLPLYCITHPKPIHGLVFAQIRNGKLKFIGQTKHANKLPNVNAAKNWQNMLNDWRKTLTKLGNDFHAGIARVDPKDSIKTCKHCQLQSLCRLPDLIQNK